MSCRVIDSPPLGLIKAAGTTAAARSIQIPADNVSVRSSREADRIDKSSIGLGSVQNYDQSKAIISITRSGTTYTYTCLDGSTGTFDQQDNDTVYSIATTSTDGLMSSSDKAKLDQINVPSILKGTGTIPTEGWESDSTDTYPYYVDVPIANCTVDHIPSCTVLVESMTASANCGLCGLVETRSGCIRFRAQEPPSTAISFSYYLQKI